MADKEGLLYALVPLTQGEFAIWTSVSVVLYAAYFLVAVKIRKKSFPHDEFIIIALTGSSFPTLWIVTLSIFDPALLNQIEAATIYLFVFGITALYLFLRSPWK